MTSLDDRIFILSKSVSDAKCFAKRNGIKVYRIVTDAFREAFSMDGLGGGLFIILKHDYPPSLRDRIDGIQYQNPDGTAFIEVPSHMYILPWLKEKKA